MKTKILVCTLFLATWAGTAFGQVPEPGGSVPPYLIRTWDTKTPAAQLGQLLGIRDYEDGDSLVGYVPIRYLNDSLVVVGHCPGCDTLATQSYVRTEAAPSVTPGPYNSDVLAGADGVALYATYYVGTGNIYSIEQGFVRVRLPTTGLIWAGQDGGGSDVGWIGFGGGNWIGDVGD